MSASNRVDLATIHHQLMVEKGVVHPELLSRYPIYQINGSYYLSFLGKISEGFNRSDLIKRGFIVGSPIANLVSIKVPLNKTSQLTTIKGLTYLEIASKIHNSLDKAIVEDRKSVV